MGLKKILFQLYLEPSQMKFLIETSEKTRRSRASIAREILQAAIIKAKNENK